MLPFIDVGHLPSSSSFYAAILQPLGLRYLSAQPGTPPSITYGTNDPPSPVLQIRESSSARSHSLKLSHIVLSAGSPAAVRSSYAAAVRAYPGLDESSRGGASIAIGESSVQHPCGEPGSPHFNATVASSGVTACGDGGELRARVADFDGNIMDIVYHPPASYPSRFGGSTIRRTQSTNEEATRILSWNYDVASSSTLAPGNVDETTHHNSARYALSGRPADEHEPYSILRRSVTTSSSSSMHEPIISPRQNSSGFSTSAVVGTLIGVAAASAAAGAAITYGMVQKDRAKAPLQEFDMPPFARRATFPDPRPEHGQRGPGRFVEVERTVEKIRYPEEWPLTVNHRPPPEYIARYSQVGPAPTVVPSRPRAREFDDVYDDRASRHSSRTRQTARTRSEVASSRKPLLLTETEHRSNAGSTRSSKYHPPIVQRSYTFDTAQDGESYVSARSHRSSSTIRPPPVSLPPLPRELVSRSKAGSRVTTTTIKVDGGSQAPRALSRTSSYMTARNIPLPLSGVGSSHADWDDDADSIAPSDSISCVGSHRSRRSRR